MACRLLLLAELKANLPLDLELLLGLATSCTPIAARSSSSSSPSCGRRAVWPPKPTSACCRTVACPAQSYWPCRPCTASPLVDLVLAAFLVLAVGLAFFRDVHHRARPPSRRRLAACVDDGVKISRHWVSRALARAVCASAASAPRRRRRARRDASLERRSCERCASEPERTAKPCRPSTATRGRRCPN